MARLLPLANLATGGRLAAIIERYRREGLSNRSIAARLGTDYGIEVSHETVRRWIRQLGLDEGQAEGE